MSTVDAPGSCYQLDGVRDIVYFCLDEGVDLFLRDQRMPQLTGPEVLDRARQEGYDVPTIVISAYEPNFEGHSDDIDRYLAKPIDQGVLLEAVDEPLAG